MRPSPSPDSGERLNGVVNGTNGNVAVAATKEAELAAYKQNANPNLTRYGEPQPAGFHDEVVEPQPVRRRSNDSGRTGSGEEVLVCSANGSFKAKPSLMRTKTKSRLMDPLEPEQKSGRTPKSGGIQTDEDDPFLDDRSDGSRSNCLKETDTDLGFMG